MGKTESHLKFFSLSCRSIDCQNCHHYYDYFFFVVVIFEKKIITFVYKQFDETFQQTLIMIFKRKKVEDL